VDVVRLPPHLDQFQPYLRQYYGTVSHSVRQIYHGYLGWFEGDPATLDPTPRAERARRTVTLMGGRERVLAEARKVLDGGDDRWAVELSTHLIRVDPDDSDARRLKARAFRRLAYASMNTNWRSWYLVAAHELEGTLDTAALQRRSQARFSSPDLIAALPARAWVEGHATRLRSERTLDVHLTAGFRFPDINEAYGLEIRRGIAQFHESLPARCDLTLTLDKRVLDRVLLGEIKLAEAVSSGAMRVNGGRAAEVERFFGFFEAPFETPIKLTLR